MTHVTLKTGKNGSRQDSMLSPGFANFNNAFIKLNICIVISFMFAKDISFIFLEGAARICRVCDTS